MPREQNPSDRLRKVADDIAARLSRQHDLIESSKQLLADIYSKGEGIPKLAEFFPCSEPFGYLTQTLYSTFTTPLDIGTTLSVEAQRAQDAKEPLVIVVAGMLGSGKTTTTKRIYDSMASMGFDPALITSEGGLKVGQKLKKSYLYNTYYVDPHQKSGSYDEASYAGGSRITRNALSLALDDYFDCLLLEAPIMTGLESDPRTKSIMPSPNRCTSTYKDLVQRNGVFSNKRYRMLTFAINPGPLQQLMMLSDRWNPAILDIPTPGGSLHGTILAFRNFREFSQEVFLMRKLYPELSEEEIEEKLVILPKYTTATMLLYWQGFWADYIDHRQTEPFGVYINTRGMDEAISDEERRQTAKLFAEKEYTKILELQNRLRELAF